MFRFAVTAALLFLAGLPAWADTSWVLPAGQSGDWSVAANWSNGVPTPADTAFINNGGTASITETGEVCANLYAGYYNQATVIQSAGSLVLGWLMPGNGGALTYIRQPARNETFSKV
jgi:hypothetical protein